LEIKFRPKLGNLNELNNQNKLFVLIDTKLNKLKENNKQRLFIAITGGGGIIIYWVFQENEQNVCLLKIKNFKIK
jgi:hypothetical protein